MHWHFLIFLAIYQNLLNTRKSPWHLELEELIANKEKTGVSANAMASAVYHFRVLLLRMTKNKVAMCTVS